MRHPLSSSIQRIGTPYKSVETDDDPRPDRPRPASLTRPVELRRTRGDDGSEYLAVFIKKPLAEVEIELLETFLDMLAPGHGWIYTPRGNDHAAA